MSKLIRCILSLFVFLIAGGTSYSQQQKIDSSFNNSYYQGRMELFESLPGAKNAIVFLGNSITERANWHELMPGKVIMNRGIGGDNTFGVLARLDDILSYKPKKIFIMIGINDIGRGLPVEVISKNYQRILERIQQQSPKTKIYVQSVLPMNESILTAAYLKNKKEIVLQLNASIREITKSLKVPYIDLHNEVFADAEGNLKSALTRDGIHLKPAAYVLWVNYLKEHKYL